MTKFLKIAAVVIPAALVGIAPTQAQAVPHVAAGWLVAAGVGGLVLGFLAANNRAYAAPVYTQPVADPYGGCRQVVARYQGRLRQVLICD